MTVARRKIGLVAALIALAPSARAQSPDVPVLRTPSLPVYESAPAATLTVGGSAGMEYHDNLFRANSDAKDDLVTLFSPAFRVRTDMKPYNLYVRGGAEIARHMQHGENNYDNVDLRTRLGYELSGRTELYGGAHYRYDNNPIGTSENGPDLLAAEPTFYHYAQGYLGLERENDNWFGWLEGRLNYYNYLNVDRRDGSLSIQDDRDRDEQEIATRLGHKLDEAHRVYTQVTFNGRGYEERTDSTAVQTRDSQGYEALLGMEWDRRETGGFQADAGVGLLQQDYDDARMKDPATLAFDAQLDWQVNDEWNLQGTAYRTLKETTHPGVAGYIQTAVSLQAEYQFHPQWQLGVSGRFWRNDFQTNRFSSFPHRIDDMWQGGVGIDYRLSEEQAICTEYRHLHRDSSDDAIDYNANAIMVSLQVNY